MPINYRDYPENWKWLSKQIIKREGNRCYFCRSKNGGKQIITKSKVVLTVHHIDGNKQNSETLNLIALCQRCHLRLDLARHIKNRKLNRVSRQENKEGAIE